MLLKFPLWAYFFLSQSTGSDLDQGLNPILPITNQEATPLFDLFYRV